MSSQPIPRSTPLRTIPMVDLAAQHEGLSAEILAAFSEILSNGRFILGAPVERFETQLAALCGTRHAAACNSGTDALWLALRALDVGPGDAVLCPAFSFFASAASIARTGATPIFVDIDPHTFNLDPERALARARSLPNLKAVLSVDLFGRLAELGALADYCADNGIPIVEDAAQSIDAVDSNRRGPGSRARIACLSFYPTKNLGALGDAGAIVTDDLDLLRRIRRLRMHGLGESGLYEEMGINSRMDALQAAALSVKLRHLGVWTKRRRELAHRYDLLFASKQSSRLAEGVTSPMDAARHVRTPEPVPAPGRHSYHRYVVRVAPESRDALIQGLEAEGIASEIYYPMGLHQQPALVRFQAEAAAPVIQNEDEFPETLRATREALALPLYPELSTDDLERIVDTVVRVLGTL